MRNRKRRVLQTLLIMFASIHAYPSPPPPPFTSFLAQDTGKRYGAKDSMKLDRLNKTEKKHG